MIVAGPVLLLGHVLGIGSGSDYGTVEGTALRFIAHTLLILGFVAVYLMQFRTGGSLNHAGMVLTVLGTSVIAAVLFVETAGAAGENVAPILESTLPAAFAGFGMAAWFVGVILFAIAIVRAGTFAPLAGWLLLAGNVIFAVGTVAGPAEQVIIILGSAITVASIVWLGISLTRGDLSDSQPAAGLSQA